MLFALDRLARHALEDVEESAQEAAGGPARLHIILLLGAVLALDAADKAAVSAVAGTLEKTFRIGHTDLGLLIACSSFVGAAFTLPAGSLVDRMSRRRVMLVLVSLWTAAMVISGTATSFAYLLGRGSCTYECKARARDAPDTLFSARCAPLASDNRPAP